jgi:uncharacterized protein YndB with AHSA1/START domain
MMALLTDSQTPVAFDLHAEVRIDAPVDVVWRSLVEDVGAWWPHSFSDHPTISMEPWVGGRFMEEWDGGSALYALVTHMVAGARLTVSGAMGLRGARQYVKTYELATEGDQTVITTTASMLGDIDEETRESYDAGGKELLQALKAHAEQRARQG